MNINGASLTPAALSVLRGIDEIGITQEARSGGVTNPAHPPIHLVGYERLKIYTGMSIAALHQATKRLREQGLITARRDVGGARPDSWVCCFELTGAGQNLIDRIAGASGIDVMRQAVIEAKAAVWSRWSAEAQARVNGVSR